MDGVLPFSIVGFDLDGTLVDTSPDLAAAVNSASATVGCAPLSVEAIRPMIGGGSRHMLRQALAASDIRDDDVVEQLLPRLLDHYRDNIAVGSRPYPGAVAALDRLEAMGVRLAVVTNKIEALATRLLDALDLTRRFETVIGGDTLPRCKPAPDPLLAMVERLGGGRTAYVGDSIYDVGAADAAGLPSIAVSFGFLDRPVAALGATRVIDSYAELIPALESLS